MTLFGRRYIADQTGAPMGEMGSRAAARA